ncbi:MAG: hypothetical protein KDB37_16105 [Ilumatobacter sp.]|nr:hypothetical protein [Ilumatobacter sp.]
MSVQYRLVVAKKDERVDGPDDADLVFTAPVEVVTADGFDATVEFMRGKVKATGHSGEVLAALRLGEVTSAFSRLASQL